MRYYNSKNIEREYIVVKHQLRGVDIEILGVRYREGYAVVAKDSKEYTRLCQIKLAVTAEYPLIKLRTLKCITNNAQVKTIWGQHIYKAYLKAIKANRDDLLELSKTTKAPIEVLELNTAQCSQATKAGDQCKNNSIDGSHFCKKHIHFDARIAAKIIEIGDIDKTLRSKMVDQWIKELTK